MSSSGEWLPIGSVVLLKGAKIPCMIVARKVTTEAEDTCWDYAACPYPFGVLSKSGYSVFMKDLISEILHMGYSDGVEKKLAKALDGINE